jgi:hypothetical protein
MVRWGEFEQWLLEISMAFRGVDAGGSRQRPSDLRRAHWFHEEGFLVESVKIS